MNGTNGKQPELEGRETKWRRARLLDRANTQIEEVKIPTFLKPPGILVARGRTFVLSGYGLGSPPSPETDVLMYAEAFAYLVPDHAGEEPSSLSAELEELAKLRRFKLLVLDPMMQPTREGTILTAIVDKLYGANASATAGRVHREHASSSV